EQPQMIFAFPDLPKNTLDPPLKWAGGKRWLVPRLRELYQPFRGRRLVEPFLGGLAVADDFLYTESSLLWRDGGQRSRTTSGRPRPRPRAGPRRLASTTTPDGIG